MIGYIVVVHNHYDSTEQVEEPSKVYIDAGLAQAEADKLHAHGQSGYVWRVQLPAPAMDETGMIAIPRRT